MAKKSFLSFIYDQFSTVPAVAKADLRGKTVVVVGANTGLGFEATQHFARMDPGRLILACRSQEKGEAAIQRLKKTTEYSKAELWLVDLSEFSSVRAFGDRALKDLERLDILLLNAGVTPRQDNQYTATANGWETTLQVNDLSFSLLSFLLLPRMLDTAKRFNTNPRIVIVASEVHFWATFEDKVLESPNAFEYLSDQEYCTPEIMGRRYWDSKLLNVFFARALNNHLGNQPIIVNSVNPGFCYSELLRDHSGIAMWAMKRLLSRSTEEGSRQLVWAAIGVPEGKSLDQLRGAYINLERVEEPSDVVLGEEGKRREDKLWTDIISVLEKVDSRVKETVVQYLA